MGRIIASCCILFTIYTAVLGQLSADLNADDIVDHKDFALLAGHWRGYAPNVDLTPERGGGFIDYYDLLIFAQQWLTVTPRYVDPVNGNDNNPGTSAQPWATIARAQTTYQLKAGQSVRVREPGLVILRSSDSTHTYGDFVENVTHLAVVTYRAETDAVPVFRSIKLGSSSNGLCFDGITVNTSCDISYAKNIQLLNSKIIFAGSRYDAPANLLNMVHAQNVSIEHCEIGNCETAIQGGTNSNVTLFNNNIYGIYEDAIEMTVSDDIRIERNHIHELFHDRKVFKDTWINPVGFIPAEPSITIIDRTNHDMQIIIPQGVGPGLKAYYDLPDVPENGSFSAMQDFEHMIFLEIGVNPDRKLYSGNISIRVCSEYGCKSGVIEDIGLINYISTDSNHANWHYMDFPANSVTSMTIDQLDSAPHLIKVWDGNTLKAQYWRGNSLGRFTTKGPNPLPARSLGIVVDTNYMACTLKIDATSGLDFTSGPHQDFIAGSGNRWVIKDNILHDGVGQGIFATAGIFRDMLIEQNLIYDLTGTTLTNINLAGNSFVRNNTFVGYLKPRTNSDVPYTPNSTNYLVGNATIAVNDPSIDNIMIYNNLVGGSLGYQVVNGAATAAYWDYNVVQMTSSTAPWPANSVKVSDNTSYANFAADFFVNPDYTHGNGRYLDYRLKAWGGKFPNVIDFGTVDKPFPAKGLGTLDANNEFILDNGALRDSEHHSIGAYEYDGM